MVKILATMEKEIQTQHKEQHRHAWKSLMTCFQKITVMISKDFPEFLIENHFELLRKMPSSWMQLHNIVLTVTPKNSTPPAIQPGLKIDQIKETGIAPILSNSYEDQLHNTKYDIEEFYSENQNHNKYFDVVHKIIDYIEVANSDPAEIDVFLKAVVLHVINISSNPQNIKSNMGPDKIQGINAEFFITLCKCLLPKDRRTIFEALLDQMR